MHFLAVGGELPALLKAHIASLEVADEGVLPGVGEFMFLQILRKCKPLLAMLTLVLLPFGVSEHMTFQ